MVTTLTWQTVKIQPPVTTDAIALWWVTLSDWQFAQPQLYQLLSSDEQARANRFKFEQHQKAFSITRGLLRLILGEYLGLMPQKVAFMYTPQGKPLLDCPFSKTAIQFNISHSHEMAVYTFTHQHRLGVDLEHIRPIPNLDQLVKRFFSAQEAMAFAQIQPEQKSMAFFRTWTQKEAYLKAVGTGLTTPLDQVEVRISPTEPAALLRIQQQAPSQDWHLLNFELSPEYIGAIALHYVPNGKALDAPIWVNGYALQPETDFRDYIT